MSALEKPYWYSLCENTELKDYFLRLAHSFSRNDAFREDLYQQAWCSIGCCSEGCTIEYYKRMGRRAMDALYHKQRRYERFIAGDYSSKKDAVRKRIKRKME